MVHFLVRLLRVFFWCAASLAALWIAGLLFFLLNLPKQEDFKHRHEMIDAIVVFTGGYGRVEAGVDLLKHKIGRKLFISGVEKGTTEQILLEKAQIKSLQATTQLSSALDLGYQAEDTYGNAQEVKSWVEEQNKVLLDRKELPIASILLVTSVYHMPRSLLELSFALPDVEIIPYPVVSKTFRAENWWGNPRALRLVFLEYAKYCVVFVRETLGSFSSSNTHLSEHEKKTHHD